MQARYYDPALGRFLNIDPVGFVETGDPRFFNRYAYTFNDPVNLTDLTGQSPCGAVCRVVVGAHVSAAASNPGSYATGVARGVPRAATGIADMVAQYGSGNNTTARALASVGISATDAYNNAIGPASDGAMALGEQAGELVGELAIGGKGIGSVVRSGRVMN